MYFLIPRKWGASAEKFVLNLCYLWFEVPGVVLLPTLCNKLISIKRGGWKNICISPQTELRGRKWCQEYVLNLCFLCFKVSEFVFHPFTRYSENKFGGCERCKMRTNQRVLDSIIHWTQPILILIRTQMDFYWPSVENIPIITNFWERSTLLLSTRGQRSRSEMIFFTFRLSLIHISEPTRPY